MKHRPTNATVKGAGFNSETGGFTRIYINGEVYHPDDVAAAIKLWKAQATQEPTS